VESLDVLADAFANAPVRRSGRYLVGVAIVVTAAACASETLPDTAAMPNGALNTNGDIDVPSADVAAYDCAHVIKGDPARAADAIAPLEYTGGKPNTFSRWVIMPSLYRAPMLQSREILRRFVGIGPDGAIPSGW
jgi:hypothetical protein